MSETLVINEIYLSLQGESTFAGLPCVFIRLTACNLRCSYCDTAYAFADGKKMSLEGIRARVGELARPFEPSAVDPVDITPPIAKIGRQTHSDCQRLPLVELTGGEPLLQPNSRPLMHSLCEDGFTVLLETSGAHDIAGIDFRVRRVMDLKCPSSGEAARNRWENLKHLTVADEIKFVIGTREDYEWATTQLVEHDLANVCPILFSWVAPLQPHQQDKSLKPIPTGHTSLTLQELAEKIIADALPVRFQLQMHKYIWPPDRRGV